MIRILLIVLLFPYLLTSQVIPQGYELESVMKIDENEYLSTRSVYKTHDSKFIIIDAIGNTFYVFNTENYKLSNKVTIDKSTNNIGYKSGMFIIKDWKNKNIYTFNAYKNSEDGTLTKIKKSNKNLEGINFDNRDPFWLRIASPPLVINGKMFVWGVYSSDYSRNAITVLAPTETTVVNNTITKDSEETETDVRGQYYALIVGINEYEDENIVDLDNPINDANNLYKVLIENYTYNKENVKIINNATKEEFLQELDNFSNLLNKNDNFTIFYAGHGYWDEKFNEGYWFLSDSYKNKRRSWVSNGQVQEYLRGISSKSTLLIADACFSGSIFKTRSTEINKISAIKELYDLPSRKAMTSGNLSTVADNSVFVKYLIQRLKENNNRFLTSEQLFSSVKTPTINNSINTQIPQYGIINGVGDEGGDFIFIKK